MGTKNLRAYWPILTANAAFIITNASLPGPIGVDPTPFPTSDPKSLEILTGGISTTDGGVEILTTAICGFFVFTAVAGAVFLLHRRKSTGTSGQPQQSQRGFTGDAANRFSEDQFINVGKDGGTEVNYDKPYQGPTEENGGWRNPAEHNHFRLRGYQGEKPGEFYQPIWTNKK